MISSTNGVSIVKAGDCGPFRKTVMDLRRSRLWIVDLLTFMLGRLYSSLAEAMMLSSVPRGVFLPCDTYFCFSVK